MEYVILILGALAMVHFVYEAIVAPTLRINQKFKAFKLRDELRSLAVREPETVHDKHFYAVQALLNAVIRTVNTIDVVALMKAKQAVADDPELRKRTEARARLFDDCKNNEIRDIDHRGGIVAIEGVRINSAGLLTCMSPVMVLIDAYKKIRRGAPRLVAMTEHDQAVIIQRSRFAEIGVPR